MADGSTSLDFVETGELVDELVKRCDDIVIAWRAPGEVNHHTIVSGAAVSLVGLAHVLQRRVHALVAGQEK